MMYMLVLHIYIYLYIWYAHTKLNLILYCCSRGSTIHHLRLDHDKLIGLNISTKIDNQTFLFRIYIKPDIDEVIVQYKNFGTNFDHENLKLPLEFVFVVVCSILKLQPNWRYN